MSTFSRAKLQRFNEVSGCAPPPGTYEPKTPTKQLLGRFGKSDRFVEPKPPRPKQGISEKSHTGRRLSLQSPNIHGKDSPSFKRSNSLNNSRRRSLTEEENGRDAEKFCSSNDKNDEKLEIPKTNQSCLTSASNDVEKSGSSPSKCKNCVKHQCLVKKHLATAKRINRRLEKETKRLIDTGADGIRKMLSEVGNIMPDFESRAIMMIEKNNDLSLKLKSLQDEIMDYRIQICTMKDEVDELSLIRDEMTEQQTRLKNDITHRDNFISLCQIKINMVKAELATEVAKNQTLKANLEQTAKEIILNKECNKNLTLELNRIAEHLRSKEFQNESLLHQISRLADEKNRELRISREEHVRITDLLCLLQDQTEKEEQKLERTVDTLERLSEEVLKAINTLQFELNEGSKDEVSSTSQVPEVSSDVCKYNVLHIISSLGRVVKTAVSYRDKVNELRSDLKAKRDEVESLESLIGPFREQLEHYEQEREALSVVTMKTRAELERIALQEAASLGHQNPRQKIKYVVMLKENNLKLKDEINDLRSKIRQKDRQIARLMRGPAVEETSSSRGSPLGGEKTSE